MKKPDEPKSLLFGQIGSTQTNQGSGLFLNTSQTSNIFGSTSGQSGLFGSTTPTPTSSLFLNGPAAEIKPQIQAMPQQSQAISLSAPSATPITPAQTGQQIIQGNQPLFGGLIPNLPKNTTFLNTTPNATSSLFGSFMAQGTQPTPDNQKSQLFSNPLTQPKDSATQPAPSLFSHSNSLFNNK